jgi:hypothetical protein
MTAVIATLPPAAAVRRRRWPWVVVVALTAAALVVGVLGFHWYTGLRLLVEYPAGAATVPVRVDHTLYSASGLALDVTYDGSGTSTSPTSLPVTVTSIVPRVRSNTSQADVQVMTCLRRDGHDGVGALEDDVSDNCSALTPFAPGTIEIGSPTVEIIVAVTPHRRGAIHIAGFDVAYSYGPRSATQRAGTDLRFTAH